MSSKLHTLCFAVSLAATSLPAAASYFNYAAWSQLPEISRAMYISGALNSLIVHHGPASPLSRHYTGCLFDLKLNGDQLAENVFAFVDTKPGLRSGSVQIALEQYLQNTCGAMPPRSTVDLAIDDKQPKNLMDIPRRSKK